MANEQQAGKQLSAQGAARRRFTRAGAAASGVLMTLHSQPGMAATLVCATPSGHASALVSARNPDATTCSGRSPGVWLQALEPRGKHGNIPGHAGWPIEPATKFGSIFGTGKAIGQASFETVLGNNDPVFDPDNLGAHLAAAYLNVKSLRSTFQNENMLVNIWNNLRDYGVFHPTAGVDWYGRDVVEYLRSTMV